MRYTIIYSIVKDHVHTYICMYVASVLSYKIYINTAYHVLCHISAWFIVSIYVSFNCVSLVFCIGELIIS